MRRNNNRKLNIIDLFAGCGGLSDGFEKTGKYKTLACVEWEREPCKTLAKRLQYKWGYKNADSIVLRFDIQRTKELFGGWVNDSTYDSGDGLDKLIGGEKIDLVIGGPPCQAYSIAGRIRDENGMREDYRNYLFESYVKVVERYQPKAFVFENVPGMLSAKPGGISIIERITEAFHAIGYRIVKNLKQHALIDCTQYNVPQQRKRVIIIGVNEKKIKVDAETALQNFYQTYLPKYKGPQIKTVRDAIGDLEPLFPLGNVVNHNGKRISHKRINGKTVENHTPRLHNDRDISTFRMLAEDIESGRKQYLKTESLKQLYYELTGRQSNIHKYHVLQWDRPSNTIPAHLYKDGLRHIHPDSKQARSITVREAARLQTFDDDFLFTGSMTDQYKMIGNAVPPSFAEAVGKAMLDFVADYY